MRRVQSGNQENAAWTPQLKGWRPNTMKGDEAFKTGIVTNMEMQMDGAGAIRTGRLGKMISSAAQAIPHGKVERTEKYKSRGNNLWPRKYCEGKEVNL